MTQGASADRWQQGHTKNGAKRDPPHVESENEQELKESNERNRHSERNEREEWEKAKSPICQEAVEKEGFTSLSSSKFDRATHESSSSTRILSGHHVRCVENQARICR